MKIAFNVLYVIPNMVGGTQTYAEGILKEFSQNKSPDDIHVYCSNEYQEYLDQFNLNISYHTIPIIGKSRVLRVLFELFIFPLLVYKEKFDIVHSLGYTCPFFLKSKNIVTIHDLNWHYQKKDFTFFNWIIWKFLVTYSAKFSDEIITDSIASSEAISSVLKINQEKITVVYPGVTTYKSNKHTFNFQKNKIKKPYIFSVSSLVPHKNIKKLLESFKIISENNKNIQLVIAGLGGKDKSEIDAYIANEIGNNKVKILGWVTNDQLAELYENAHIFLFVSLYEGFGFPILEAFAHKVPVVSSSAYSLKEIAGSATKMVDPTSAHDISEKTLMVLDSKEELNELVRLGSIQVQKFTWEKTYQGLHSKYREILR